MMNAQHKRRIRAYIRVIGIFALITISPIIQSVPITVDPVYQVELYATGVGAADGLAFNSSRELFATDYQGGRILKFGASFVPGTNNYDIYANGIAYPTDLAFIDNDLFVASSTSSSSNVIQVFPDSSTSIFATGFSYPTSIEAWNNILYVANSGNGTISQVDTSGAVAPFLSGFSSPNGPYGISFDSAGNLYFTDHNTGQVLSSDLDGNISSLGALSPLGATFTAMGPDGFLYVSDVLRGEIFRFDLLGNASLFASGFVRKLSPPGIGPTDIIFDNTGNMFVGDGDSMWRISSHAVPEPSTIALLGLGLAGLGYARRKKSK